MPGKTVTEEFRAWLRGDQTDLAICLKLTPQNADPIGFTTWDSDFEFAGVQYEASNAVSASTLRADIGNGIDNMEISGLLQSDSITDEDIAAGKYDTSKMLLVALCPTRLSMGSMVLVSGVLGQFKTRDNSYVVEVRSLMQRMSQQTGELLAPACRVFRLGDNRCKFDVVDGTTVGGHPASSGATVTAVLGEVGLRLAGIVTTGGYYTNGTLKFTSGPNAGIEREVQVHGDPAAVTSVNVSATPGGVGYNSDITSGGTPFTLALPAGDWLSGYLTVEASWDTKGDGGDDSLLVEVPAGDQYEAGRAISSGKFAYNVDLSPSSMAAINTISGAGPGNIACKVKHSGNSNGFNVNVPKVTLTLTGTPASTTDLLVLAEAFPYDIVVGDTATAIVGCDRLISTCHNKFNNAVNFRGEPWVPGIDHMLKVGRN